MEYMDLLFVFFCVVFFFWFHRRGFAVVSLGREPIRSAVSIWIGVDTATEQCPPPNADACFFQSGHLQQGLFPFYIVVLQCHSEYSNLHMHLPASCACAQAFRLSPLARVVWYWQSAAVFVAPQNLSTCPINLFVWSPLRHFLDIMRRLYRVGSTALWSLFAFSSTFRLGITWAAT